MQPILHQALYLKSTVIKLLPIDRIFVFILQINSYNLIIPHMIIVLQECY